MSRVTGIEEEVLADLGRWRESERFGPLERLALELAEAMSATPPDVTDELRERLLAHLSEGQLTELAAAIAWGNHRGRLNKALGVRAVGFADGTYCVLPQS